MGVQIHPRPPGCSADDVRDTAGIEAYVRLAWLLGDRGKHDQAQAVIDDGLKNVHEEDRVRCRLAKSQLLERVGEDDRAEAILREAVAQDVADEKIALAWCNVLLTYGDVREGRTLLGKIKATGPVHPLVPFCLALGYQSDGDFAAAR